LRGDHIEIAAQCGQKLGKKRTTPVKTQPILPPMLGEFLSVEIQASLDFHGQQLT